jgi:hypothetical protein
MVAPPWALIVDHGSNTEPGAGTQHPVNSAPEDAHVQWTYQINERLFDYSAEESSKPN